MNNQGNQQAPVSTNRKIFGTLADLPAKALELLRTLVDHIAPGLPAYARALIIVIIVAAALLMSCLVICALIPIPFKTLLIFWVPICALFFVVVACIFVMGIMSSRKNVDRYPTEEVIGKNTINLGYELKEEKKDRIRKLLKGAAMEAAKVLNLSPSIVRSNLFGRDEHDVARIITDFTFQMNRAQELTIGMRVGEGSTGRCFLTSKPNIAVLENDWGKDVIERAELRKVHPDLKWILSVPIVGEGVQDLPIWVLNVDGLHENRHADDLRNALSQMFKYSKTISLVLAQE